MKNFYFLILIVFLCTSCSDKEVTFSKGVVKTLKYENVKTISATCTGLVEVTDGSIDNIIESGICYATTQKPIMTDSTKVVGMQISGNDTIINPRIGIFTANLTGLQPSTTYYIRAYTIISSDVFYGNEIRFKTHRRLITERDTVSINTFEEHNEF